MDIDPFSSAPPLHLMSPHNSNTGVDGVRRAVQNKISDISRPSLSCALISSWDDVILGASDVIGIRREWPDLSQNEGKFRVHPCLHSLPGKPAISINLKKTLFSSSPQLTHWSWPAARSQREVAHDSFFSPHSQTPSHPLGSKVSGDTCIGPRCWLWWQRSESSGQQNLHLYLRDDHCGTGWRNTCIDGGCIYIKNQSLFWHHLLSTASTKSS